MAELRFPMYIGMAPGEEGGMQQARPTESPSKQLPGPGALRIRIPNFANEPEIYQPSLAGAGNDRKMRFVALEYPARLLLECWRSLGVNECPNGGASTCLSSLRR